MAFDRHSSGNLKTVFEYRDLIQAIAKQEYDRLGHQVSFREIVRMAALAVHITLLSRTPCNANSLVVLMREAIRLHFDHVPVLLI